MLLLGCELVTNAVVHTGTAPELTIEVDDEGLRVAVADRYSMSPLPIAPAFPPHDSEGGRGLLLVANLADRWGVEYAAGGKQVWFRLGLAPPQPESSSPLAAPPAASTRRPPCRLWRPPRRPPCRPRSPRHRSR